MKTLTLTLFLALVCSLCFAQSKLIDSLSTALYVAKDDKNKVLLLSDISYYYRFTNPDSALVIGQKALELAKKINYVQGESNALSSIGAVYRISGDMQKSMFYHFESLRLAEKHDFRNEIAKAYFGIGVIYSDLNDFDLAIKYLKMAFQIYKPLGNKENYTTILANIGEVYNRANQLDSALHYLQFTNSYFSETDNNAIIPFILSRLGDVNLKLKNYDVAFEYAIKTIKIGKKGNNVRVQCKGNKILSECYQAYNKIDSAIYFAKQGFRLAKSNNYKWDLLESSNLLADLYDNKNLKEAYYYTKLSKSLNDSLYGADKVIALQKKIISEQAIVREKEAKALANQNSLKQNALLFGLGIVGIIGFILYHNNKQKQKANNMLYKQKEEINQKSKQLETSLTTLKSTQAQLIHSEKMASLGELTAGIAHEIQNPLNFVNNFSDVNTELLTELKAERLKPNAERDESLEANIINDVIVNEQKINHHGKRADAIVKGMLQHSQTNIGQKEPTNINALADEYLRLSYHGLRAKDKDFNADFTTDFDEHIGKIEVVPQDIGRVLLNLYNNAFYAVNEKNASTSSAGQKYVPTVSVSTTRAGDKIELSVKDNGTGIPQKVVDKIFQPFFTTKPTGQGTGLGLSLSYDIIKAHGGEIKVETNEGEGTQFTIILSET